MSKPDALQLFIRKLTDEVTAGTISKEEAARLALAALSEVAPTPEAAAPEPAPEPAPAPAPAPAAPADTKTQILALLTQFEQAVATTWDSFQQQVTQALQNGAASLGNLSIDAGDASAKLRLEQKGQGAAHVIYTMKKEWSVDGLTLPAATLASAPSVSTEQACHLPIRRSILAIADDVLDMASSELSWQRCKLPITSIFKMRETAAQQQDRRAISVLSGIPEGSLLASRDDWRRWAVASQVFLVGNDFTEAREFNAIKAEIEVP